MVITATTFDKKMDSSNEQKNVNLILAMIGLPSAGKSTMINSLLGKHILRTGVCRTTKDAFYVGPANIFNLPVERYINEQPISDDEIKYTIIDLPGVCDGQDDKHEYDDKTSAWITNANIICWVSDIQTAFITTHEKTEFDKYKNQIDKLMLENGTMYQMCIVLTKYDYDDTLHHTNEDKKKVTKVDNEIDDSDEDTTIHDCYKRVADLFKTYADIQIIKFNAFGRIQHCENMSPVLKKMVKKDHSDINAEFKIQWAIDDYTKKEQQSILNCAINKVLQIYDLLDNKPSKYGESIENLLEKLPNIKNKLDPVGIYKIRRFLFCPMGHESFCFPLGNEFHTFTGKKTFSKNVFIAMQNTIWINVF